MRLAIVVLTRDGLALARKVREASTDEVAIFGPSCIVGRCGGAGLGAIFAAEEPGVFGWTGPLRRALPGIWSEFDGIIAVMALGIVVRMVGPLAIDKRRDPAIVAVDDAGRFAISVLGGHGARANELAVAVADAIGAIPVVTTASEAHALPAVDRLGADWGWAIERGENLTRVAAAVVRRERVAVWQDAGRDSWWRPFGTWPAHFTRLRSWDELPGLDAKALLVISDRVEPTDLPGKTTLVYRPPTLLAGIGCKRGTSCATIDAWIARTFAAFGYAEASLAAIATVTLKIDEPGLVACAAGRRVPLVAFPARQLADVPGIETPSERVRSKIGIAAVAEPSALLGAGASRLLVPKQTGPGVTLALARRVVPEGADYRPR